jgi:hypothetical protein
MLVAFLGPDENTTRPCEGSTQPFAGWIVGDDGIAPSTAFVVEMPTPSHSVAVWRLVSDVPAGSIPASPELRDWAGTGEWTVLVPRRGDAIRVVRNGSSVFVDDASGGSPVERLDLRSPPSTQPEIERIDRAYQALASEYRPWRELYEYRQKATLAVLLLLLAQELLVAVYRRVMRKPAWPLRLVALICWTLLGLGLHFVYFGA